MSKDELEISGPYDTVPDMPVSPEAIASDDALRRTNPPAEKPSASDVAELLKLVQQVEKASHTNGTVKITAKQWAAIGSLVVFLFGVVQEARIQFGKMYEPKKVEAPPVIEAPKIDHSALAKEIAPIVAKQVKEEQSKELESTIRVMKMELKAELLTAQQASEKRITDKIEDIAKKQHVHTWRPREREPPRERDPGPR